jgi:2'-5' RNA ligase
VALWLVPEGEAAARFGGLIDRLAARHGTPRFHPHLTLLGALGADDHVARRAQLLAADTAPFEITLARTVGRDEFFRAVVVEAAPSLPLLRLHHLAREAFDKLDDPSPFEPHLSLVYGDLPRALRDEIIAGLPDVHARFRVTSLGVWSTDGTPEQWRELARYPLTGEEP